MLTPASLFDLGGAAGLHTFLLRIFYIVNGDKIVIEGISKINMGLPNDSTPTPWIQTLQRIFREHQMPNNTVCFTDGSWTAATESGHRFVLEPSPEGNVATAGILYCAESDTKNRPNFPRAPANSLEITPHIGINH